LLMVMVSLDTGTPLDVAGFPGVNAEGPGERRGCKASRSDPEGLALSASG
jgi:hypothetical protein